MSNMNSTTPDFSEDKGLTYSIQHSAPELTGDKEQMQAVGVVGDAVKGSAGHISPAKTTNTAKAIREPTYYGTYLVPGINTEKRQYNAGDDNED